jgi:aquaporin Z
MKKYIAEFIGTMFLVMGAALYGGIGASLCLMVMIYASGHISGAHFNPAVTLAVMVRKRIGMAEAMMYWVAQLLGGIVAALLVTYLFKVEGMGDEMIPADGLAAGLVAELLGTFALAYVVLNVATAKGTDGNSFYGLAIAGTVLAMALTIGKYSGGAYNPAVAIGLSMQMSLAWSQLWIYLVGSFAGAALAGLVFGIVSPDDMKS